jgi:thiol-disulfide isomerase/thioredoxin
MSPRISYIFVALGMIGLLLSAVSCTKTDTSRSQPVVYSAEAMAAARQLTNEGYELLAMDSLDAAVAKFAEIANHVNPATAEYHSACAYGRTGGIDEAFEQLTSMLSRGYDRPDNLRHDTDFENLHEDARWEELVALAEANFNAGSAAFADGMPEYAEPPVSFATEEEFDNWADSLGRLVQRNASFRNETEAIAAKLDFAAGKLAAQRALKAEDPEFDYGLERVREIARLKSPYDWNWGAVSDLVTGEANRYLGTSPDAEGAGEANYRAAGALSLKYGRDDDQRTLGFQQAENYLANVAEGTKYYGASRALSLTNRLQSPGADEEALKPEIKAILEEYGSDPSAYRVVSTRFENSAARYAWPIELLVTDLGNKEIELNDYRGKVLMIDFWATWCPPCRAELPNLVEVYEEYNPKGLEIVSISLDYTDQTPIDAYKSWIDSAGMDWRHSYSGNGWDTEVVKRYYVGSIPAPFLVGPDGSLIAWGGDLRGEELENTVKNALGI